MTKKRQSQGTDSFLTVLTVLYVFYHEKKGSEKEKMKDDERDDDGKSSREGTILREGKLSIEVNVEMCRLRRMTHVEVSPVTVLLLNLSKNQSYALKK